MAKRRKPRGKRAQKPAFLIVSQGKVTEAEYFKRLKSALSLPNLKIVAEPHSPEKIVGKARNYMANDRDAPYDRVFFVVDVDESSTMKFQQGISEAKKSSTRATKCSFVISNQCFEVWLLAHYENLVGRSMERSTLAQKLINHGGLESDAAKHIAEGFPIGMYDVAAQNVTHAGWDEVGVDASTAMPALIEELTRAAQSN